MNRRRYLFSAKADTGAEAGKEAERTTNSESPAGAEVRVSKIVKHVRMLVSLIEGRPVSLEEVLKMLARNKRQHRMSRERRLDYIVWQITDHGT